MQILGKWEFWKCKICENLTCANGHLAETLCRVC